MQLASLAMLNETFSMILKHRDKHSLISFRFITCVIDMGEAWPLNALVVPVSNRGPWCVTMSTQSNVTILSNTFIPTSELGKQISTLSMTEERVSSTSPHFNHLLGFGLLNDLDALIKGFPPLCSPFHTSTLIYFFRGRDPRKCNLLLREQKRIKLEKLWELHYF